MVAELSRQMIEMNRQTNDKSEQYQTLQAKMKDIHHQTNDKFERHQAFLAKLDESGEG